MSHIFISYSHKDKDYAHKLHRALTDRGFDAWIDDRIDYGSRWPREIETRLQGCSAFILVMSPDAKESDWVQNELLTARRLKKPIVPLLLEGEVWWHLQTAQYVDVTGGKLPPENFFIYLARIVARHQANAERIPDPAEKPKNEAPSIHIGDNASGNTIIIGDQNAVKSGAIRRGPGDPRPTTAPVKRGSGDPRSGFHSLRSQLAGFVPATISGKLTILLTILAAISVCAAVFVTVFGYPPRWFENIPDATLTPALMASATSTPALSLTPVFTATITVSRAPSLTPAIEISFTPTPYPAEITQKDAKMVLIPAGKFKMGSNNGLPNEKPIHVVSLDVFYIDEYEVTNAFYKACVDTGGCSAPSARSSNTRSNYYGNSQFDNYPVIYVNWNQAKTYCEWRGARLPSEAEWEYAARGTDERTYPWGEGIDTNHANYDWNDTTVVGHYESGKSPFGVYDMAGNVWEWVNGWYDVYPGGDPNVSRDFGQKKRVLRGGAWNYFGDVLRSAFRLRDVPSSAGSIIGFRCARTP